MAKYRKIPENIEAIRFTGFVGNGVQIMPLETVVLGQPRGAVFYIQTQLGREIVNVGDWIITQENGSKYTLSDKLFRSAYEPDDNQPSELDDGLNCTRCGQSIAKRKVMFASALAGALVKAYFKASEKQSQTIIISELQLNHSEYTRINDLVRFGLLYRQEGMQHGEYGVPRKRVAEFLNNQWPVAAYFYKNPVTKENEMSTERIYFRDVPSVAELVEKCGPKLTSYIQNDVTMVL